LPAHLGNFVNGRNYTKKFKRQPCSNKQQQPGRQTTFFSGKKDFFFQFEKKKLFTLSIAFVFPNCPGLKLLKNYADWAGLQ
jgi:hypothetical protein